jgi:hypothetical protein
MALCKLDLARDQHGRNSACQTIFGGRFPHQISMKSAKEWDSELLGFSTFVCRLVF